MRTRPLLAFFALTFGLTWSCFAAAAALSGEGAATLPGLAGVRWPLLIVGAFAPSAAAVYLTAQAQGQAGVHALLARLGEWRVGLRWYLFAVCYMAGVKLAVALLYRATTGGWPRFGSGYGPAIVLTAAAAAIFGGPLGEEIGWRGYALPRLAERFGRAKASVVLGLVWAAWHLPVFFIPGMDQSGQSLAVYVIQVTALSVAMAWLYWHTGGSLLLAVLMHTAINQGKDLVPSAVAGASNPWGLSQSPVGWLTVVLLWVTAGCFLARLAADSGGKPAPRGSSSRTA